MKKLLFLFSLAMVMLIAAPQASAGPPGDVQHVCLSVDVQTAVVSYDLAMVPDAQSFMTETVYLIQTQTNQIVTRAVTYITYSYAYEPPDAELRESEFKLNCLLSLNHQKISLIRDNLFRKNICHPLDTPHY